MAVPCQGVLNSAQPPGSGFRCAVPCAVCPKAKGSYRPFAWERGKLICAVNPAREEAELPLKLEDGTRVLHVIGKAEVKGDELVLGAQSFCNFGVKQNRLQTQMLNRII